MTDFMYENFRRLATDIGTWLDDRPPQPRAFKIHHSVPFGRAYRQWDTLGHLYVWLNPGVIFELPRATMPYRAPGIALVGSEHLTGIPVVWG